MRASVAKVENRDQSEQTFIDVSRPQATHSINATLLDIVAATHQSPLKVMRDYIGLAFGPGKISFKDYQQLRLFDMEFWSGADRKAIAGQRCAVQIHQTINFRHDWWGMLDNKVATSSYLSTFGFPTIPIAAVYSEGLHADVPLLVHDEAGLCKVLTCEDNYPLFGKPTEGLQSLGSVALRRYRPNDECLETIDGRMIGLGAFVAEIRTNFPTGYMLQKFVSPHASIRAMCGDRLATVRIITLGTEAGPRVFRTCWKIPAGPNAADNYWRKGNLLAKLDLSTGAVLRVLSGTGLDIAVHDRHPDTDALLIGFQIPHWPALLDTVIEAARLMQHVPLIGWDVASLDQGPVIVEMNERPDFLLPQLADGRGVLEPELTDFLIVQRRKLDERKKFNEKTYKDM